MKSIVSLWYPEALELIATSPTNDPIMKPDTDAVASPKAIEQLVLIVYQHARLITRQKSRVGIISVAIVDSVAEAIAKIKDMHT